MEASKEYSKRNLLDLKAVFWAGILSGLAYILTSMVLSWIFFGTPWSSLRIAASLVMGSEVIFPLSSLDLTVLLVGVLIQLGLALLYTLFIAFIFHRGGLLVGILGGAAMGLALYAINYNNFSAFFPWIFPLRHWILLVSHIVFGALSGGLYELFEEDEADEPIQGA